MAYSYEQILQSQYQRIAEEQAASVAELEAGRLSEDAYRTTSAADRILELDKSREALDRRANEYVRSQQAQPQGNPHNLSQDEMDIAKGSHLTPEQYSQNKRKYQAMKSQGYWDQGRVFK